MDLVARLLFMLKMHKAYAVTGTVCTGAAAQIPGTLVHEAIPVEQRAGGRVRIGHPSGVIDIDVAVDLTGPEPRLTRAALGRTTRRLMEGYAFVPWSLFR